MRSHKRDLKVVRVFCLWVGCCNHPSICGGIIKSTGRLNLPIVDTIPGLTAIDDDEILDDDDTEIRAVATPATPTALINRASINYTSLCKLKIFMNCAINTINEMDTNRNNFYRFNRLPFSPLPDVKYEFHNKT